MNGKLLMLGFEQFHSRYISLRLVFMTVVKFPLVNKKNAPKKILPRLTEDRCNISVMKDLFYSSDFIK